MPADLRREAHLPQPAHDRRVRLERGAPARHPSAARHPPPVPGRRGGRLRVRRHAGRQRQLAEAAERGAVLREEAAERGVGARERSACSVTLPKSH